VVDFCHKVPQREDEDNRHKSVGPCFEPQVTLNDHLGLSILRVLRPTGPIINNQINRLR
jgi:hypothetical protein